jgi:hypothetical protein
MGQVQDKGFLRGECMELRFGGIGSINIYGKRRVPSIAAQK